MVAGSALSWELGFQRELGSSTARLEFPIDTPVAEMIPIVREYARAGVRPLLLAGFQGRLPSGAEAEGLGRWAAAFGPGGTAWQDGAYPAGTAVTEIEFGNETNNPAQFDPTPPGDWYKSPRFLDRAAEYAVRAKQASIAIARGNGAVGTLLIADQYSGYTTWVDAMFEAVPNLDAYADGWTAHPYGPQWHRSVDDLIAATRANGARNLPLWFTEWGLASDGGACLSDNFGWDPCMSFAEAAQALNSTIAEMGERYGDRLRSIYLYHAHDLRDPGATDDREAYFGALRLDKSRKGAYTTAVENLLATYR